MTVCRCQTCETGVVVLGHCMDIDGETWHLCPATDPDGDFLDEEDQRWADAEQRYFTSEAARPWNDPATEPV